ncbi:MAG: hypothetical protein U9M89_00925 [Patescibacteria group bacterium]|nr:hypothetical protein [Patescibacteria group bacterium]
MRIETEIKLALDKSTVKSIIDAIEKEFNCKKINPFHQTTHQFFFEDYTKQNVFPRIRNEEDGNTTFTIKVKPKEDSPYFKRTELETVVANPSVISNMMPFLGFPQKISWEKKRHAFSMNNNKTTCFFLDETPMGWFLEIEATEDKIEEAIIKLGLQN